MCIRDRPNPFQSRASITAADHTGHGCSNTARRFAPLQVSPPSARRKIPHPALQSPKLQHICRSSAGFPDMLFSTSPIFFFSRLLTFCRAAAQAYISNKQNACRASHSILYHSICSTGTICSFLRISVTVPFFTVIIRSAIAVIAWLCVMTTTVTPFLRQVSCSSFSTALPVL